METCYLLLLFLGASEWRKMEKNEEDHNLHSSPLWKLAHHRQKVRRGKENYIFFIPLYFQNPDRVCEQLNKKQCLLAGRSGASNNQTFHNTTDRVTQGSCDI